MSMGFPLVRLGDVLVRNADYVSEPESRTYPKLSVKLYGKGVVLDPPVDGASLKMKRHQLARSGQVILSELWGKKGAVGLVPPTGDGALCTSHFFLFDPLEGQVEPGWLQAIFQANYLQAQLENDARGTTGYAAVRPKTFLECVIPLPPLDEQRRIVARIEELARKVERARAIRREVIREFEALEGSILASALQSAGPLEPLGELINPGSTISYGVLVPGPDVEDGVPFVRVQDLDVTNPPPQPAKRISREVEAAYARSRLTGCEVLIGVVGSIGKIGVVPNSWVGANIARAVCRVVPGNRLTKEFLVFALRSKRTQDYFRETTRTLAQPTLNVKQLRETLIPVPSLDYQRVVVQRMNHIQVKLRRVARSIMETADELDALLPAILDRAFKGEL